MDLECETIVYAKLESGFQYLIFFFDCSDLADEDLKIVSI